MPRLTKGGIVFGGIVEINDAEGSLEGGSPLLMFVLSFQLHTSAPNRARSGYRDGFRWPAAPSISERMG